VDAKRSTRTTKSTRNQARFSAFKDLATRHRTCDARYMNVLTMRAFSILAGGCAVALCSLSACSSSSSPAATTDGGGSSNNSAGAIVTTDCNAMKIADAQALVKAPVVSDDYDATDYLQGDPFTCNFNPADPGGDDAVVVTITPSDAFDSSVAAQNAGTGTAISGVGDKAVWVQDGTKANPPIVVALKGSITCQVIVPGTESTTITYTSPNGFDQIATADAASYAQKMAVLCTEVFASGG
jgi:hypothetical protein